MPCATPLHGRTPGRRARSRALRLRARRRATTRGTLRVPHACAARRRGVAVGNGRGAAAGVKQFTRPSRSASGCEERAAFLVVPRPPGAKTKSEQRERRRRVPAWRGVGPGIGRASARCLGPERGEAWPPPGTNVCQSYLVAPRVSDHPSNPRVPPPAADPPGNSLVPPRVADHPRIPSPAADPRATRAPPQTRRSTVPFSTPAAARVPAGSSTAVRAPRTSRLIRQGRMPW